VPRLRIRRPSAPLVISLIALFVALGGPAEAQRLLDGRDIRKNSVSSRQIKDRTIAPRDLSRRTVRRLSEVEDGAVTSVKLSGGAVTPGKLAPGAVGSPALADRGILGVDVGMGALTGEHIADRSLTTNDSARFAGRFRTPIPDILANDCWSGDIAPAEIGNADISQDLVVVTPGTSWPALEEDNLTFTARNSPAAGKITLIVCSLGQGHPAFEGNFRYAVFSIP
jgi:hypothetical protein